MSLILRKLARRACHGAPAFSALLLLTAFAQAACVRALPPTAAPPAPTQALFAPVTVSVTGREPAETASLAPPSIRAAPASLPATPQPARVASPTPAPLVPAAQPTELATPVVEQTQTATPLALAPSATRPVIVTRTPGAGSNSSTQTPTAHVLASHDPAHPETDRQRVGVALAYNDFDRYRWGPVPPGWYLSWMVNPRPVRPDGVQFAQMARVRGDSFTPDLEVITVTARLNPGSLWLIGNEPDVPLQDNVTPEQYAPTYHKLYSAIKAVDPTAQIAIGGIGQPTPLRLAYLDRVLRVYRDLYGMEMPVDVWNVHAFILREERGAWGVGIPPGLEADQGQLYELADHDNMAIFRRQIVDFRRWMAEHGQRDKPLIVTEYGILMPEAYGFTTERVTQFMTQTFDYFLTARDPQLGDLTDDNRLVQSFVWFSSGDKTFPAGNLFNPDTLATTPVGQAFKKYLARLDGYDPSRPVHPGGPVP